MQGFAAGRAFDTSVFRLPAWLAHSVTLHMAAEKKEKVAQPEWFPPTGGVSTGMILARRSGPNLS